jgi:hypothetical protein
MPHNFPNESRRRFSAAERNFRFSADTSWQPGEIFAFPPTVLGSRAKFSLFRRRFLAAGRNFRFSAGSSRQPGEIFAFPPTGLSGKTFQGVGGG